MPDSTIREIAAALELTERRVSDVLQELVEDRLIAKVRCGRKNSYEINIGARFRVGALGYLPIRGLLEAFAKS
jgi:predicted transcriptional regulator